MSFVIPFVPVAMEFAGVDLGMWAAGGGLLGALGWGLSKRPNESPAHYFYGSNKKHRITGSRPVDEPTGEIPIFGLPQIIPQKPRWPEFPSETETQEEDPQTSLNKMSDNVTPLISMKIEVNNYNGRLVGAPIKHQTVNQKVLLSSEGQEKMEVIGVLGTVSQWVTNTAATVTDLQSPVRWLDLNPGAGIAPTTRYIAQNTPNDDELLLQHATQLFEFVNLGNTPCFVELAPFKCKAEQTLNPKELLSAAYTNAQVTIDGTQNYPTAGNAPTAANFSASNQGLPFLSHYPDANSLTKVWKRIDHWKFQLAAGGRMAFKVSVKMDMLGNLRDLSDNTYVYPKGCLAYSVSCFGQPVLSSATNVANTMVRSVSKVGVIVTSLLTFRTTAEKSGVRDKRYTGFYNIGASNTTTQEEFMDTDQNAESIVKITS